MNLRAAIRNTRRRVADAGPLDVETNPRWVAEELAKIGGDRTDALVEEINAAAEFPLGELIMPEHSDPSRRARRKTRPCRGHHARSETTPGRDGPPPMGSSERYALPLLHLAAFFTARFIYGRFRTTRKNVFLDETHLMGVWGSDAR